MPGTFTDAGTGYTGCTECTAGYYCPGTPIPFLSCIDFAVSVPTDCPEGSYCPTGSVNPVQCPQGTFRATANAETVDDCTICSASSYCEGIGNIAVTGTCAAGYFKLTIL
jgi:hypothetical protein